MMEPVSTVCISRPATARSRDWSSTASVPESLSTAATPTCFQGNFIGTDVTGTIDLGNTGHGIYLQSGASNNTIGGDQTAGLGNIVSGNNTGAIYITGAGSNTNTIQGNMIGVDASGTFIVSNSGNNIDVNLSTSGNLIGGTTTGAGNVIGGGTDGITLWANALNIVQGNYIGTDVTGTLDLGNLNHGIAISGGTTNNVIGGVNPNEGNVIAFNENSGVSVWDPTSDNNRILGNSIYRNAGLGIDINNDGLSPNDSGDGDSGPNDQQNFPVFTSLSHSLGNTTVNFDLNTNQAGNYRIEFFVSDLADGSGQTLVHSEVINHVGGGNRSFVSAAFATSANAIITATATEDFGGGSYGSTSEFSQARTAQGNYVLVVDTTSDVRDGTTTSITNLIYNRGADGKISLREAIEAANASSATDDLIQFEILDALVGGVHTINVGSWIGTGLDLITDTVIIDATTDWDFAGNPVVQLNGVSSGGADGLVLSGSSSDGSTIRGLIINQFDEGIRIDDSDNNTIVGNWIGLDSTGTADQGNTGYGVEITSSSGNTIGGSSAADRNVISGNDQSGISLWTSVTATTIQGNYIGLNAAGTSDVGNTRDGIAVGGGANANIIGGDRTLGQGNVISGNLNDGIELGGAGVNNNLIYGNLIGTDYTGTVDVGNVRHGVVLYNQVQGTQVGGTGTGQGNVISKNKEVGVVIDGNGFATTTNNVIAGNIIGLDITGVADLGNISHGISVFGSASGNTIGGNTSAHRNVISGNAGDGINSSGDNLDIEGNYIGLNAAGTASVGNTGDGIDINGGANITVGGTTAAQRNVISGNDGFGVYMNSATSGNFVLYNYIGNERGGHCG